MESVESICRGKTVFLLTAMGSLLFVGHVGREVNVEANGCNNEENGHGKEDKAGSVAFFV